MNVRSAQRRRRIRDRMPTWLSRLLLLTAVLSLVGVGLAPGWPYRGVATVLDLLALPTSPSLFQAALLFVLAGPIARRYRAAHTILVTSMVFITLTTMLLAGVLIADALPSQLPQPSFAEKVVETVTALTNLASTVVVWWARPAFTVRMRARPVARAALVLIGGMAASYLLILGLLSVVGTEAGWHHRARWALLSVLGVVGESRSAWPAPMWVEFLGGLFAGISVVAAFAILWRAETRFVGLSGADELRVRTLIRAHGEDDSLAYFATRRDKSVIFSPDGRAAVAYRQHGDVSIASGDPIGEAESWPAAVDAFLADAHGSGRHATVLSVSRAGAELYAARGLTALALGDEAVLHTDRFTLAGPAMRAVRHGVGRVERAGYAIEIARFRELAPTCGGRSSAWPTRGAVMTTSAGSRWPSAGWATPPTVTACWCWPATRTDTPAGCCLSCRGAAAGCPWM